MKGDVTARVAFLRAANLGKRTVKMSRVVEVFEGVGCRGAWTHVNSGNVAFDGTGTRADLERKIQRALESEFGFEITTFVRSTAELQRVVTASPFVVADGDTYFVTFLKTAPSEATARALKALSNEFDTLVVRGRDVHWRMHGKSTDSRLRSKDWEIVGKHASTSRNMNMLRKFAVKVAG
jgi:uncharacterized protein (DUF1697 family)